MYQNLLKSIESLIIAEFRATKHWQISYWESYADRETLMEMGTTKSRQIVYAEKEYQDAQSVTFLEIQTEHKGDFCLCLRAAMRKLYLQAVDFSENPYIKIQNFKKIILMREILNASDTGYLLYSTKYLINV